MIKQLSFILLLTPFALFSTENTSDIIQDINNDMSSIAKVAKDQRANIDYLPYITTVFEGRELSEAGVSTLKEALSFAAGVNIASDNISLFNPVFRGSNPVAYGQSKLIIDNVEVNDLVFDGYTAYLAMPIEIIKRIEIVRGPGSYKDGHFGYAGSIVVTTYKSEHTDTNSNRWFTSLGTHGTKKAGGTFVSNQEDLTFAADVYTVHDDLSLAYGVDALSNNLFGEANAPLARSGKAPSSTDATMLSASISNKAFFVDGRFSTYRHGEAGGMNYALAHKNDHYTLDQWQIRAGSHYTIENLSGTFQLRILQDSFKNEALIMPEGTVFPSLSDPSQPVNFPDGFYGIHEAFIRTYQFNNTLIKKIDDGEISVGITGTWSKLNSVKALSTNRDTGTGITDYSATTPFIKPNSYVNNLTSYLSYERTFNPSLTGYATLTMNHRNDLAAQIDPRIATVYTIDSNNLLKFSISRAHRNPSWQEMFAQCNVVRTGNLNLKAESVMAYETQFIHQFEAGHTLSANLFYLNNNNQISLQYYNNTSTPYYQYVNGSKSKIKGFETEWRKRYDTTSFYAAYTHILAEDGEGATLPNAPSNTARGFITYTMDSNWYGSVAGRWQSTTPRTVSDTREEMKAIAIFDTSIGYKLPKFQSELQLSAKNIFNNNERYPSPEDTYRDDYPSTGRTLLLTLRGTF